MMWTLCGGLSLYGGQLRGGVLSLWRGLFGVVCLYVVDVGGDGLCLYMVDIMKEERLVVCLFVEVWAFGGGVIVKKWRGCLYMVDSVCVGVWAFVWFVFFVVIVGRGAVWCWLGSFLKKWAAV